MKPGENWLSLRPSGGTGNGAIVTTVAAKSLDIGTYNAAITITAPGAINSPSVLPVLLTVKPHSPAIASDGIFGAAGSVPAVTDLAPGGLITILGSSFAPAGASRQAQADDTVNGSLPTNLAGVCVLVGGVRGFISYVDSGQVNLQVPALGTNQSVEIQVIADCDTPDELRSPTVSRWVQEASPEFFYWARNEDGVNPVYAVNASTISVIAPSGAIAGVDSAPAKPGDIVSIYGIAFGPTDPPIVPGIPAANLASTVAPASVNLGGVDLDPADILYSGVAPGVPGWYQLQIRIPGTIPTGNQPLTLNFGIYKTPPGGFLAIGN
jgi:uncharacterized protein (TIGR03437 family)